MGKKHGNWKEREKKSFYLDCDVDAEFLLVGSNVCDYFFPVSSSAEGFRGRAAVAIIVSRRSFGYRR